MAKTDIPPTSPEAFVPDRFRGRVMLVTGAAMGSIGGCTAIRAAREGARVACVDVKDAATQATVDEIRRHGGDGLALLVDVSRPEEATRMVHDVLGRYGRLDLVLNAAGVMDGRSPGASQDFDRQRHLLPARVHEATDEYWHAVFAGNIHSMFYALRAELRQMVAQGEGGAIVNVAIDYAPHGIRINAVNMAQPDTPMVARAYEFVQWVMSQGHGASMAGAKSQSLLQLADSQHRGSTPWEQASVILFLLSDDASNITGAAYATDGGWTAY